MTFITQAAQGRRIHWTWYILGIVCIFIGYFIGQIPLTMVAQSLVASGDITLAEAQSFYLTLDFTSIGLSSTIGLLLLLCSFITALFVLFLFVRYVHNREGRTLISSRSINWNKIFFALILWFVLTIVSEIIMYLSNPGVYHFVFEAEKWLPLMLVVLLIIPLQTSFEELFVRGYLMQRIGLAVRRPWIAVLLTSLFFGLMHGTNPEIKEFGFGVMMAYYISVGAFLAILTILDDGLEFALGIHAATNIYGAGFVTYKGAALQTDTLYKVEVINPLQVLLLFFLSAVIFYILVQYRYQLLHPRMLFQQISRSTDVVSVDHTAEAEATIITNSDKFDG